MKQNTGIFTLQWSDAAKGFITTIITTLVASIWPIISAGGIPAWIEFKPYLITSISAGIAYIIKNYFSNNQGQFAKPDAATKMVDANAVVIPANSITKQAIGDVVSAAKTVDKKIADSNENK